MQRAERLGNRLTPAPAPEAAAHTTAARSPGVQQRPLAPARGQALNRRAPLPVKTCWGGEVGLGFAFAPCLTPIKAAPPYGSVHQPPASPQPGKGLGSRGCHLPSREGQLPPSRPSLQLPPVSTGPAACVLPLQNGCSRLPLAQSQIPARPPAQPSSRRALPPGLPRAPHKAPARTLAHRRNLTPWFFRARPSPLGRRRDGRRLTDTGRQRPRLRLQLIRVPSFVKKNHKNKPSNRPNPKLPSLPNRTDQTRSRGAGGTGSPGRDGHGTLENRSVTTKIQFLQHAEIWSVARWQGEEGLATASNGWAGAEPRGAAPSQRGTRRAQSLAEGWQSPKGQPGPGRLRWVLRSGREGTGCRGRPPAGGEGGSSSEPGWGTAGTPLGLLPWPPPCMSRHRAGLNGTGVGHVAK